MICLWRMNYFAFVHSLSSHKLMHQLEIDVPRSTVVVNGTTVISAVLIDVKYNFVTRNAHVIAARFLCTPQMRPCPPSNWPAWEAMYAILPWSLIF